MSEPAERSQEPFRAQRLYDHGRQIRREVQELTTTAKQAAGDVDGFVRQQTRQHPYRTLATAAGVGYVIGGGLSTRMTKALLAIGYRLTMAIVARELIAVFEPSTTQTK